MDKAQKLPVNIPAGAASKVADETATTEPGDELLVERCQQGDIGAFESLVGRYRQRVYQHAYGMLRNEQDATDIAQEAFVRAWQALPKFNRDSSFYTWVYRITTNLTIDFCRKRSRRPAEAEFEEGVDPDVDANMQFAPSANPAPDTEAERSELRKQIDIALEELSPEHRAVIQLREFDGLDYAEIARVVGCSLGTVMSRLHYARKHLQKLLKDTL